MSAAPARKLEPARAREERRPSSVPGALDETLRAIIRDVVREEIRAALSERAVDMVRRNGAPEAPHGDGYFSIARAAAFADVAPGTLRRWIRSGRLPVRRAGRVYRIARAELEDFLQRQGRSANVTARARAFINGRS
jgi:excisionase family DNA binding protein